MPIQLKAFNNINFFYVKVTGTVSMEDILSIQQSFFQAGIQPGYRLLFDARLAVADELTQELVTRMLHTEEDKGSLFKDSKVALVITEDVASEWASKYATLTSVNTIVFFNLSVALTWLGVTDTSFLE